MLNISSSMAIAHVLAKATTACSSATPPETAAAQAIEAQLQVVSSIGPTAQSREVGAGEKSAYLMSYFKDETHSLYFATSRDGCVWTDVNGGRPVL